MIKKIIVFFYIILVCLLGLATFIEAAHGTGYVEKNIYHALYFCILWGILSFLSIVVLLKYRMWRRFPVFLLHISFILILSGALTTFINGKKGYIHLRSGSETGSFILPEEKQELELPFIVKLDSFHIEYYPGSKAPKDYISHITCMDRNGGDTLSGVKISMNRIWTNQGYRFYQTSFDKDESGSVLTVNHDPWGTGITYAGYLLLALSMILVLFSPQGTFMKLIHSRLRNKEPHKRKKAEGKSCFNIVPLLILIFSLCPIFLQAENNRKEALPALKITQACSLSREQVVFNDRIAPMNTLARNFLLKLYGKDRYKGLTPEQIMGGWILYPDRWKREPILYIKDAGLRKLIGIDSKYTSLEKLFDGETYRLQALYGKGNKKLDKAIIETDEKVGLISMLLQGTLIKPVKENPDIEPLSDSRINVELIYNRIPFCKILFMLNLAAGIMGLAFLLFRYMKGNRCRNGNYVMRSMSLLLYIVTVIHTIGYIMHWYIAGHIPLSNGYETMLFMAMMILVLACMMHRRYSFMVPFGLLLSGFTLLVAYIGQKNPQITPLMPVLQSPWLSSHVSLIMMSYALFALMMFNGILAIALINHTRRRRPEDSFYQHQQIRQLTFLNRIMLYPAVFLLGIGIFLGAIWANESWGRYWAWDPKEVWALVTFMVYGAAFHLKTVKSFRRPLFYHIYLVLSFLTILMTYFGVNYFLGGMHSYA